MVAMFLMDRDEMSNHYRGPAIDASYQVSVHLAKWFQKRLKCEKLTDDRRRMQGDGVMVCVQVWSDSHSQEQRYMYSINFI